MAGDFDGICRCNTCLSWPSKIFTYDSTAVALLREYKELVIEHDQLKRKYWDLEQKYDELEKVCDKLK